MESSGTVGQGNVFSGGGGGDYIGTSYVPMPTAEDAQEALMRQLLAKKARQQEEEDDELDKEYEDAGISLYSGPLGRGSGSYPGSIAPLQMIAGQNPGNQLIASLLRMIATKRTEGSAT